MDEKSVNLLYEVNKKMQEIEDLVEGTDMQHRVLSVFMFGVIPEEALSEDVKDETVEMNSLFYLNIQSKEELESVIEAISQAYDRDNPFDDIIKSLGFSLN